MDSKFPKSPSNWVEEVLGDIDNERNQSHDPITTVQSETSMSTISTMVPVFRTFNSYFESYGQQARADSSQMLIASPRAQNIKYASTNASFISMQALWQKRQEDQQRTRQQSRISKKEPRKLYKESSVLGNRNNLLQTQQNLDRAPLNSPTDDRMDISNAVSSKVRRGKAPHWPRIAAKFDLPYRWD